MKRDAFKHSQSLLFTTLLAEAKKPELILRKAEQRNANVSGRSIKAIPTPEI
jgi:hypothetical protein